MSRVVRIGSMFVGALTVAAVAIGQTATTQSSPTASGAVTVEGCLKREADVPGRKPNAAESVGVGEDFILMSTKMVKGSAPGSKTENPLPGVTVTRDASEMFDVKGLSGDQLKSHVNERVEIVGTFDKLDRVGATARDPNAELVELRGTSIRPISGSCATP